MQNYEQIFAELGIEIPEDKLPVLNEKMAKNYKTVAELEGVRRKRDEYKESLDTLNTRLGELEKVDVDGLQTQIGNLKQELDNEKAARAQEAAKLELEKTVTGFFGARDEEGKLKVEFVNPITENALKSQLMEKLQEDSARGKSVADIFNSLVTDAEGNPIPNILVDKEQQALEGGKARFTQSPAKKPGKGATAEDFKSMTLTEKMKLKMEHPDIYEAMRKEK